MESILTFHRFSDVAFTEKYDEGHSIFTPDWVGPGFYFRKTD